jgi:hypothetical protein
MKKRYETPNVEIVKFEYSDQVVAQSTCVGKWVDESDITVNECTSGKHMISKTNIL